MPTNTRPATRGASKPANALFHKTGLIWFWVLNDDCTDAVMDKMLAAFVKSGAAAVCLHPRCGLTVPYGGTDWFDLIRRTTEKCAKAGLQVWLYDEDPYPSGAAGGRVFFERPEFEQRGIERFEWNPKEAKADPLFWFPTGALLWCGWVNAATGETIDLTDKVGTARRKWTILDKWDSRFYYPDTPLYYHPRSWAEHPEYTVRLGDLPPENPPAPGMKLVAFVARPCGRGAVYGGLHDTLNPDATRYFIQLTHDKYKEAMGDLFGKEITAIFTDEPKWFDHRPYTPGMFDDFERQFGYDLRPRLEDLFSNDMSDRACLTRLQYRQWLTERFEKAWVKPIADWCNRNNLVLTGHISPEEEPISEAAHVGDLHVQGRHFGLAGIDLIIPAVGDQRHPMINANIVRAAGLKEQYQLPGVMSETLGASGLHPDVKQCEKVLVWQTVMGLTSPVVHYAQNSVEGLREFDAPPDFGPFSDLWPGMVKAHKEVAKIQPVVHNATQVAPVVILWNVRSFWMQDVDWQNDTTKMRSEMLQLLSGCLDHQVGTHMLSEVTLWDGQIEGKTLAIGKARYSHVLIPSSTVWHTRTIRKLKQLQKAGVNVIVAGRTPHKEQTERSLDPLDMSWATHLPIAEAPATLPRLIDFPTHATDIRCTAWSKGGKVTRLLMNLRETPFKSKANGKAIKLGPGQVIVLK